MVDTVLADYKYYCAGQMSGIVWSEFRQPNSSMIREFRQPFSSSATGQLQERQNKKNTLQKCFPSGGLSQLF